MENGPKGIIMEEKVRLALKETFLDQRPTLVEWRLLPQSYYSISLSVSLTLL